MTKKKPTPRKKADRTHKHSTPKRKPGKPKSGPDEIMAAFFDLISSADDQMQVMLGKATAGGAVLALSRTGLVADSYVFSTLAAIDIAARARSFELKLGKKETLQ